VFGQLCSAQCENHLSLPSLATFILSFTTVSSPSQLHHHLNYIITITTTAAATTTMAQIMQGVCVVACKCVPAAQVSLVGVSKEYNQNHQKVFAIAQLSLSTFTNCLHTCAHAPLHACACACMFGQHAHAHTPTHARSGQPGCCLPAAASACGHARSRGTASLQWRPNSSPSRSV